MGVVHRAPGLAPSRPIHVCKPNTRPQSGRLQAKIGRHSDPVTIPPGMPWRWEAGAATLPPCRKRRLNGRRVSKLNGRVWLGPGAEAQGPVLSRKLRWLLHAQGERLQLLKANVFATLTQFSGRTFRNRSRSFTRRSLNHLPTELPCGTSGTGSALMFRFLARKDS